MSRVEQIFAAYEIGELGDVEFLELALEAGADLMRINKALAEAGVEFDVE